MQGEERKCNADQKAPKSDSSARSSFRKKHGRVKGSQCQKGLHSAGTFIHLHFQGQGDVHEFRIYPVNTSYRIRTPQIARVFPNAIHVDFSSLMSIILNARQTVSLREVLDPMLSSHSAAYSHGGANLGHS